MLYLINCIKYGKYMSINTNEYIENHLATQRAGKCRPILLQKIEDVSGDLVNVFQCEISTPYPTERIQPSLIKVGIKEHRVCIRVDETQRLDRGMQQDYFADDLNSMKKMIRHMRRIQRDYDRTTWFLRAQLIPSILGKVSELIQHTTTP